MKSYYTEKQYKELLSDLTIIHDSREQENSHIIEWFDKKKVKHVKRALELGDYCFSVKNNWFTDELFIERKNSLDELADSILSERFLREIRLSKNIEHKIIICENGSWEDILKGSYKASYSPKAFWNTLHTYIVKYGINIVFTPKNLTGQHIYSICKTVLNQKILKG